MDAKVIVNKERKNVTGHEMMNYNRITEFIYIGNNMCCRKHFEKELLHKGIKAVISLEYDEIDDTSGMTYFFWLPWMDATAPRRELLKLGVSILCSLAGQKIKTYVHCRNGQGRAPTLVAAYFISKGFSADEAIAFIKNKRPVINPVMSQMKALKEFESVYKSKD